MCDKIVHIFSRDDVLLAICSAIYQFIVSVPGVFLTANVVVKSASLTMKLLFGSVKEKSRGYSVTDFVVEGALSFDKQHGFIH